MLRSTITLAGFMLLFTAAVAGAADQPKGGGDSKAANLSQVRCWDLATMSEEDRAYSLMFYYGYLAGRRGLASIQVSAIDGNLVKVRDYCSKNPNVTLVKAFPNALKK